MSFSWLGACICSCALITNALAARDEQERDNIDVDQEELGGQMSRPPPVPVWCSTEDVKTKADWLNKIDNEFTGDLLRSPALTCCLTDEAIDLNPHERASYALREGLKIVEANYEAQLRDWCPASKLSQQQKYATTMALEAGVEVIADVCPMYKQLTKLARDKGKDHELISPTKYFQLALDVQQCAALKGVEKLTDANLMAEATKILGTHFLGGAINVIGGAGHAAAALALAGAGFGMSAVSEDTREEALESFLTNMAVASLGIFVPGAAGQAIGGGTALDLAMIARDLKTTADEKPQMQCKEHTQEALTAFFLSQCKTQLKDFIGFFDNCAAAIGSKDRNWYAKCQ